ncbi:MAG: sulfurtransferase, partial [Pseudomonadota bacterium]
MTDTNNANFVETDWLQEHLDAPDILVIDASWHLPDPTAKTVRNAQAEYANQRIPGAVFFDLNDIKDETSNLPTMLPSTVKFASKVKKLGIGDGCRIIVYDTLGLFSAARAWWMFKIMGHTDVAVLNGGLPKWMEEGRPLEDGPARLRTPVHFTPQFNNAMLAERADVEKALQADAQQVVDARPAARFRGEAPEPRESLRRGHMPGSTNVPFANVLTSDRTIKSSAEVTAVLQDAGIDLKKPVITSCGSGVTAA